MWKKRKNRLCRFNFTMKGLKIMKVQKITLIGLGLIPLCGFPKTTGELVYAIRAKGYTFRPKVFARGVYKIETRDPILNNGRC